MTVTHTPIRYCRRPGLGREGTPRYVFCNTFNVTSLPNADFFHYDVVIDPPMENRRRASEIIQKLQSHIAPQIFSGIATGYDGAKNLFSVKRELFDQGTMSFDVQMTQSVITNPRRDKVFRVTLKFVNRISPEELNPVLEGAITGPLLQTTSLQVLNLLLQHTNQLRYPVYTKSKVFLEETKKLIQGFEIWRGYYFSIRPVKKSLILNIDISTAVMYPPMRLIDFMMVQLKERDARRLQDLRPNDPSWLRLKSLLLGVRIEQLGTGIARTIRGFQERAGEYEFGSPPVLIKDYFYERYHIRLVYPSLPGIISFKGSPGASGTHGDENRSVIPFELCVIKGGQMMKKRPEPELMSDILNFAKRSPRDRLSDTKRGYTSMQLSNTPFIQQSGLSFASEPMSIKGRVLEHPYVRYQGQDVKAGNGVWNMMNKKLLDPQEIVSWVCIHFRDTRQSIDKDTIFKFARKLAAAMNKVGIKIQKPPGIEEGNSQNPESVLYDACNNHLKPNTSSFLLIFLPKNSAGLRARIKRFGNVSMGVVTQCVRIDKVSGANDQYLNNLIIKINPKLGGINTIPRVEIPNCEWLTNWETMIVGADVTHASPGVWRPSIAALVASYDKDGARYFSTHSVQGPRMEIIADLEEMLVRAFQNFYSYRRYYVSQHPEERDKVVPFPTHLIFFRDGVSEGELDKVVGSEIKQIKDTFMRISRETKMNVNPKLTFIVVGKRHHIRFFPRDGEADRSGNAPAGFVVDDVITSPGLFDFYLQSHAGLLGTSRSSHYIVIHDENDFSADGLQKYCFDLCHLYARSTRSVSIPAPVYYADILCSQAEYHFSERMNFMYEASTADGEFDTERWKSEFRQTHSNLRQGMHFL